MNKIKITTTTASYTFEFPWDWLESTGLEPELNDLEAKAERGITTGTLYRVRQAEIPSLKLNVAKCITQAEA